MSMFTQSRTASALVMTMGLLLVVFSMIGLATNRLVTSKDLALMDQGLQQATASAEAVAAFKETLLVQLAATNELESLTLNPETKLADDPWEGTEWFAGCLVRWRVEPVRVADASGQFITNPFLYGVNAAMQADANYLENHDYYHYRITSEAHYLRNQSQMEGTTIAALEAANELPWQNPQNGVCKVQATRIVQMRLNSLFKYALFHAKEGGEGDIEIGPGQAQNITGRVHTNGAIYIAGGGMSLGKPSGWGAALVGSASEPVDMVGIDGIYRLRKDTLLNMHRSSGSGGILYVPPTDSEWGDKVWYGDGQSDPGPLDDTYPVPVGHNIDDTQTNPNHTLNGVSMRNWNDSRSPDDMVDTFGAYMRDSFNSGATIVKTLSNIPQLGGRPFEAQRLFGEGTPIWTLNPGDPNDISSWTILPNEAFKPGDYYVDPLGNDADATNDFDFSTTGGVDAVSVVLQAKRLYYVADPRNRKVTTSSYPSGTNPAIAVDVDEDGDGILDNAGVAYDPDLWYVDAGGLRQWYQRDGSGDGIYRVDGDNTSEAAKSIVDIFDTQPIYEGNPKPNGPSDALTASTHSPGDANFRYNGVPALDSDGDSFGDNEVLGTYLDWAMNGKNDADNTTASGDQMYGLVIRERRYQNIPDIGSGDEWAGMPDLPNAGGPPTATIRIKTDLSYIYNSRNYMDIDAIRLVDTGTGDEYIIDDPWSNNSNHSSYTWTNDDAGTLSTYNWSNGNAYAGRAGYFYGTGVEQSYEIQVWLPDGNYDLYLHSNPSYRNTYFKMQRVDLEDYTGAVLINDVAVDKNVIATGNWTKVNTAAIVGSNAAIPLTNPAATNDYTNYLKSQYVAYFGPYDVTDLFFSYGAASAGQDSDYTVFERWVLDRREAVFMQYQFWNQDASIGGTEWRDYKSNILSFNMRATLDFLMNTDYGLVTTGVADGTMLNEFFNGMIYCHRTRRSDVYTPWGTTRWHPDCYGMWNRNGYVHYSYPPSGHKPYVDNPSSVWPALGFDWRTGSGPAMTYHSAVRLTNAADLNYGINYYTDRSTPDPSDDYYTKKGLTFITPNHCYVWGDYNTVKYADSDSSDPLGTAISLGDPKWDESSGSYDDTYKHVPAAIFADYINILSNDWSDTAQGYNYRTYISGDTWMMSSVITNNIPSHVDGNNYIHSSEGSHNLIRYNEGWGSRTFHLKGSNVVMNVRRYSRSHIAYRNESPNLNTDVYDPPNRDFQMNSDLFTKPGQPPFTPFGVTVTRTVSTIEDFNN